MYTNLKDEKKKLDKNENYSGDSSEQTIEIISFGSFDKRDYVLLWHNFRIYLKHLIQLHEHTWPVAT